MSTSDRGQLFIALYVGAPDHSNQAKNEATYQGYEACMLPQRFYVSAKDRLEKGMHTLVRGVTFPAAASEGDDITHYAVCRGGDALKILSFGTVHPPMRVRCGVSLRLMPGTDIEIPV